MEVPSAPNHRGNILKALSQVPIATTKQLAMLNDSLDPQKKASRILGELARERLVKGEYHRKEKVWSLTKQGRQLTNTTPMKLNNIDHSLAVINLYFTLRPSRWMFEPIERYTHLGRELAWAPDAIFVHQKKVYVCEMQLTPISSGQWEKRKWRHYNTFFNSGYFKQAAFQKWSEKVILPQFLVITSQLPETVRHGFAIEGRELIVTRSF
jgi:hypothetical protein